MMAGTIVLRNIRGDMEAVKPLAADVVHRHKRLVDYVERYHRMMNADTVKDQAAIENLQKEILIIDCLQRVQLNLVREVERTFLSDVAEDVADQVADIAQEPRPLPPSSGECINYFASLGLVHVDRYEQVCQSLDQQKKANSHGKRVYTPGPWQILAPPSKVFLRQSGSSYCANPLYVTVRAKNPLQTFMRDNGAVVDDDVPVKVERTVVTRASKKRKDLFC